LQGAAEGIGVVRRAARPSGVNAKGRRRATMKSVTTFLMFAREQHGKAEEAMRFYTTLFDGSQILSIERYGASESEPEGTVKAAVFSLNGREFMAMDSARPHPFTFTPAISLYVECDSLAELERAYKGLLEGGTALMPLGDYGFSTRFGWVEDRFGVSWQLNVA
jgi:predicted 3-demethylubiquinone-9 3-methyltransferase (glyoxalase superfamily)